MPTADFLAAAYPLLEASQVEVLEWSFDTAWNGALLPDWAEELLAFYASQNRLLGHGVFYSLLSGTNTAQLQWLHNLARECMQKRYLHISEHYGFSQAGTFIDSTQLPVPATASTLALGLRRLELVAQTVPDIAIGVENLAFAFSAADALAQGPFLKNLLTQSGSFLVLDIHNLYCQAYNFEIDFEQLLLTYPLELVKQIHVSGGSFSSYENLAIRRDTHDDAVPDELFNLLAVALDRCPNVEAVILERLGGTINGADDGALFRADFIRLKTLVDNHANQSDRSRPRSIEVKSDIAATEPAGPDHDLQLALYQECLLELLNGDLSAQQIIGQLQSNPQLAAYSAYVGTFEPRMVDAAKQLVKRWGKRAAQL